MRTIPEQTGAVIGTVADFTQDGGPVVTVASPEGISLITARSCVPASNLRVGHSVVLLFEGQCFDKPIIVGTLSGPDESGVEETVAKCDGGFNAITVDADGRKAVLSATEEIVLTCGKASITLTRAGKVLIRGAYVSSHSSGVNRIKGGAVEIN